MSDIDTFFALLVRYAANQGIPCSNVRNGEFEIFVTSLDTALE